MSVGDTGGRDGPELRDCADGALAGLRLCVDASGEGADVAGRHATALLRTFGVEAVPRASSVPQHPSLRWARSGAMALTGTADAPRLAPGALADAAEGALRALRAVAGPRAGRLLPSEGAPLLGERAAALGGARRGPVSVGGSCRLLATRDGTLALNLARTDDVALLRAWLESDVPPPPPHEIDGPAAVDERTWAFLAKQLASKARDECVARGRMMGLAVAPALPPEERAPTWVAAMRLHAAGPRPQRRPRVLDFGSLWAAPLCGSLLRRIGAEVVKVESRRRPDGARRASADFFSLLNGGKRAVAFDPSDETERDRLCALVDAADIVIEGSRPRALRQLGIESQRWLRQGRGRVWTSLTGYGNGTPEEEWVAFGDDAAVAAGLAVATGSPDRPVFCGDAIADPLAGLHAAVATLASWEAGGGLHLDLSLERSAAQALACSGDLDVRAGVEVERRGTERFAVHAGTRSTPVAAPRLRPTPVAAAPALGEWPLADALDTWTAAR